MVILELRGHSAFDAFWFRNDAGFKNQLCPSPHQPRDALVAGELLFRISSRGQGRALVDEVMESYARPGGQQVMRAQKDTQLSKLM